MKVADIVGVQPGAVLAGKYRVDRILGAGGMGVVVAAHHLKLDERVAIKFLLPEAMGNPEAVARFEREARAAVKIKSEHVARVSDVGTLDTGAPYMVMEYLEGGDLAAWIQQKGALAVDQAVEFVLQTCEAVAEAHGQGIVHRDLKPANLFCIRRSDGLLSIKVLDFGISKVTALSASVPDVKLTKTAAVMGSPLYMSPEQLQAARNVDARTDIWAIGVILYELLTGQTPFSGETMPALVLNIAGAGFDPVRNRRPDVPAGIEAIIARCLEKDRAKRYADVAELAVSLAEFGPKRARASAERASRILQAAGLSASALALPPSSDPTEPADGTIASWGQTKRRSRSTKLSMAIAALGLIGAALLTWNRWSQRDVPLVADRLQPAVSSVSPNVITAPTVPPPEPAPSEPKVDGPKPALSSPNVGLDPGAARPSASAGAVRSPPGAAPVRPRESAPMQPVRAPKPAKAAAVAKQAPESTPPVAAPVADPFANPK